MFSVLSHWRTIKWQFSYSMLSKQILLSHIWFWNKSLHFTTNPSTQKLLQSIHGWILKTQCLYRRNLWLWLGPSIQGHLGQLKWHAVGELQSLLLKRFYTSWLCLLIYHLQGISCVLKRLIGYKFSSSKCLIGKLPGSESYVAKLSRGRQKSQRARHSISCHSKYDNVAILS